MGYECPVCDAEEADGEHLANHLAFTALVRGGDHEAFLDEHVPDWESMDPETLAPEVTPHATETDTETVTEPQGHAHHEHDQDVPTGQRPGQVEVSGENADILEEAVDLTEAMHDSRVADPEADTDEDDHDTEDPDSSSTADDSHSENE